MKKKLLSLGLLALAFNAGADVPDRPDFCMRTICISTTQGATKVESTSSYYDATIDAEQVWIWLKGGVAIGLRISAPTSAAECNSKDRVGVLYPQNRVDGGCRFVTASTTATSSQLEEIVSTVEIAVWGLEEFPNGSWDGGIAQRIGPSVSLCTSPSEDQNLFACGGQVP
jgi:hypothetical protein